MKSIIFKLFILITLLASCNKENNDVFSEQTAFKFIDKEPSNNPNFKYQYTLLKYNNSWYAKIIDNIKYQYTDVIKYSLYSNQNKPMYKWIGYSEWMRDTSILILNNNKIDSILTNFKKIETTNQNLYIL